MVAEREQTTIYSKAMWEFIGREKKRGVHNVDRERDVVSKRARGGWNLLIRDPLRMCTEPNTVMQRMMQNTRHDVTTEHMM